MPIYMDRHDLPGGTTAKNVFDAHEADIKIQHKYGCKGLTYWFDEPTGAAFCLVDAPSADHVKAMHDKAHGLIPHKIIEVDPGIVRSFLGRIEDPIMEKTSDGAKMNIINDPAFRTIMAIDLKESLLIRKNPEYKSSTKQLDIINDFINKTLKQYNGLEVNHTGECLLSSFADTNNAVLCALNIMDHYKSLVNESSQNNISLHIGLNAGVPVTDEKDIFGDTVLLAKRLCDLAKDKVMVSTEVRNQFHGAHANIFTNNKSLGSLNPTEENYLTLLMDKTETIWNDTSFTVEELCRILGMSKSQLNRRTKLVTGKSPNNLIKDIRLKRALRMIKNQKGNIAEIAYETGFNSPAYFSKCFQERFGVLPSSYAKHKKEYLYQ